MGCVSFDPYRRYGLREPDAESCFPPYVVGQPIWNTKIGKVFRSDNQSFQEGDIVVGLLGTEEYSAVPSQIMRIARFLFNPYRLDPRLLVGILDMAGLSAYSAMKALQSQRREKSC